MYIHHSRWLVPLCLLVALSVYGCDDNGRTDDRNDRLGPSPIRFNGLSPSPVTSLDFPSRAITLQPPLVVPEPIAGATCPSRLPFLAPIRVVAGDIGDSDLFLSRVQMQFVDGVGRFGESMTLAHPQLVELFGSTRIPRLGTRSFPFSFRFGCLRSRPGRVSVVVFAGDSFGHELRTTLSLPVR